MNYKILQNIKHYFVVTILIFTFGQQIKASSPSNQPAPLRNQSLLFETRGKAFQEIKLDTYAKKQLSVENGIHSKSPYRNRIWKVEGGNYDIPIRYNSKVKSFIRKFTSKHRKKIIKGIKRSGKYMPMIYRMLHKEGLPLDLVYMVAVESNFNVRARSKKNAVGLWQFIASTGRIYGLKINRWIDERRDPVLATKAAITYLKHLYGIFGDWELAMAAYNTGEGRVKRTIKRAKEKGEIHNFWALRLPRETRGYVPAIMATAVIYKNPKRYGFGHVLPLSPIDETTVSLTVAFSLEEVAKRSKISFDLLRKKNPALFLGVPPMTQRSYSFYIPKNNRRKLMASLKLNPNPSKEWGHSYNALLGNSNRVTRVLEKFGAPIYFRVKTGDNLWDLSRKHKTSIRRLARWNRLNSKSILRVNRRLKIYVPTWRVFREIARNSSASSTRLIAQKIRIPKGGSLSVIAKKYRTSVKKLMRWNNLNSPHAIREGHRLVVGYRKYSNKNLPRGVSVISVPRNTTLSHLAIRYKTSTKNLMKWNGLTDSRQLRTGMRLYVKSPSKISNNQQKIIVAKKHSRKLLKVRHKIIRVRNGDTLWGIAKIYRTTIKELVVLNELKSESHLRLNQKLIVPYRS